MPARAVGAIGREAAKLLSGVGALGAAVASGRTTVIGARIDPSGYVAQSNALREL